MVELLSEPLYIISSTRLEFGRRASIDTAAMITKCLVTLVMVMRTSITPALVFAAAQLAFSGVVLLGYARYGLQLWRQVGWWTWLLESFSITVWHSCYNRLAHVTRSFPQTWPRGRLPV